MTRRAEVSAPGALGLDPALEAAGFNAAGALAVEHYDELVPPAWRSARVLPGARSAAVLGCGGRAFGEALSRAALAGEHPIDAFTRASVERAVQALRRDGSGAHAVFYWERREDDFADFVALGRACGLGTPSRLGVLIHPTYGPWISIRAVILTGSKLPPTPPLLDYDPCRGCPAPCAQACPGDAVGAVEFDFDACARTTRARPDCRQRCAARRACVVGREHAYPEDLERRYRQAVVATLEREATPSGS